MSSSIAPPPGEVMTEPTRQPAMPTEHDAASARSGARAAGNSLRPRAPISDWFTMVGRSLRLSRRNVDTLITSIMLPVILMLLFVYLFGGAIDTGTAYVTYVVPGVILLCAAFGSATTAISVSQDMKGGIVDRFRSMDIGGAAVLGGHVVASVVRNLVATALVFGVALLIGFRPEATAGQWLGTIGLLLLFMLAISWLAAAVGLLANSPEAASGFTFLVMFLPYASSAFVPINTMPSWLHGFARSQPCTPLIESIRALLADEPTQGQLGSAIIWCSGILVLSVLAASALFARKTR